MKRKHTALILVLLMVMLALMPGCRTGREGEERSSSGGAEKTEPLRVFVDVEYGSNIYFSLEDELADYMQSYEQGKKKKISFQALIDGMGGPSIKLEIPPIQGNERDMYFTSLRTEIMAGGGPDVFVCMSGIGYHMKEKNGEYDISGEYIASEPLFNFPQQAMKRNMFLALDDYIEKAQFMEWEKLTPAIMDAGKTEDGQFLLPLTYTVPAIAFRKTDVGYTLSKDMKWEDMLSQGPQMCLVAVMGHSLFAENALAPVADYEHDKLAVSEEEMIRYYSEKLDNLETYKEESDVPYASFNLRVLPEFKLSNYDKRFEKGDQFVAVPLYSRNGGYMATITSFAAVNANTKHPDDAFFVVDYLLGEECQRSKLYAYMTVDQAVPILEGLMTHGTGVSDGDKNVVMPDNYYEQFCAVRDSISFADFATPLDYEIQQLYFDLLEPSTKSRETIIHDAYMRMNMMLAES